MQNDIHSSLTADHYFYNGDVGKRPAAWKKSIVRSAGKHKLRGSMNRFTDVLDIASIEKSVIQRYIPYNQLFNVGITNPHPAVFNHLDIYFREQCRAKSCSAFSAGLSLISVNSYKIMKPVG